jgi:hypothetical protein
MGGVERRYLPFVAFAPAVAANVFFGQMGFVTATLIVVALTTVERRPLLAGALLGILTIKPQLGLLLPVVLVLTGRWRALAAAMATIAVMAGLTAALYGPGIWSAFFTQVGPQQHWLLYHPGPMVLNQVPSALYAMFRIGLPLEAAWAAQIGVSAAALAAVVWTFARRRDPVLSNALLIAAIFLVTPYSFCYDMVVLVWPLALLRQRADNAPIDHVLILAVWVLPVAMMIIGLALGIPLAILVLPAFAARLVWRLAREARTEPAGSTPRRVLLTAPTS